MGQFIEPMKTYAETDILKDSNLWDYLKYLQLNRINFLSTVVWDNDKQARNQLLNTINAVYRFEFMCWEKIKLNPVRREKYLKSKPRVFREFPETRRTLEELLTGDSLKQLELAFAITDWLRLLDPYLTSMKHMKKTAFMSGVGPAGSEDSEASAISGGFGVPE